MTPIKRSQEFLVGLLSDLYSERTFSDVRVFHKSQVISLHGSVLSSVSPFWKAILDNGEGEDFVDIIFDDSIDFESFSTLFELAYKGSTNIKKQQKDKLMGKVDLIPVGIFAQGTTNAPHPHNPQMYQCLKVKNGIILLHLIDFSILLVVSSVSTLCVRRN